MGQDESGVRQDAPLSEMDAARAMVAALNRIADGIYANAAATELLARATAGEFDDQGGDVDPQVDMAGRPLR